MIEIPLKVHNTKYRKSKRNEKEDDNEQILHKLERGRHLDSEQRIYPQTLNNRANQ